MTMINRIPAGWLGFLGIKNFGRAPSSSGEVLAPTWDLADLYLNSNIRYASAVYAAQANGVTVPLFTAPLSEVWVVHQFGCYVDTAAGAACQVDLVQISQAGENCAIANSISLGANGKGSLCIQRPVMLSPGEALGFRNLGLTGNGGFLPTIRYTPLVA